MNATATHTAAPDAELDGTRTLRELRAAFLDDMQFDDGEVVHKKIEWVKLGPIPIPIPNPPSRVAALKLHDTHHLITGYGTDWVGEYQISGWEVGAGLHRNPVAWTFCLMGHTAGLVVCPRKTVRAFARGRRGRTLFGQDAEVVFDKTLDEGRAFCGTDQPEPAVGAGDVARALGWGLLGVVTSLLPPIAWMLSRFGSAPSEVLTAETGG